MKIISFTMVNNEGEIIESFIRYNYNFVDEMVVIDNGCTDNTVKILQNLIEEGYDIQIYDESLQAYDQFRLDNKYLDLIIKKNDPDIVIPLDADEFIVADENPRSALEKLDLDAIYYVNWQWYVMTKKDNFDEKFIPLRLKYCLDRSPWNYSDGSLVTKVIIPAKYYQLNKFTMSMGHHTVYGKKQINIQKISNIKIAHYRAISESQLINKTSCYTVRDISSLDNNFETAQRTNQMALIESGSNMLNAAIEASFGGYKANIIFNPVTLQYCSKRTTKIQYSDIATISRSEIEHRTGCEMAIKYYNAERHRKERPFLKPIILWMDGTKGKECIFPNPSNHLTMITAAANVRAYITSEEKIKFLKANYRLIITPEWSKFIPHTFIVIPNTVDFNTTRTFLVKSGIDEQHIISWKNYLYKLNIVGILWLYLGLIPGIVSRVHFYIKRNGLKNTIKKIHERVGKK